MEQHSEKLLELLKKKKPNDKDELLEDLAINYLLERLDKPTTTIKTNDHRLTLRIPKALMERIDVLRAQRPGIISRNQWILETLQMGAEE